MRLFWLFSLPATSEVSIYWEKSQEGHREIFGMRGHDLSVEIRICLVLCLIRQSILGSHPELGYHNHFVSMEHIYYMNKFII